MKAQNLIILGILGFIGYKFIYKPMRNKAAQKKADEQQNQAIEESDIEQSYNSASGQMDEVYGWNNAAGGCDREGQHCLYYDNQANVYSGVIDGNCNCVPRASYYGVRGRRSTSSIV